MLEERLLRRSQENVKCNKFLALKIHQPTFQKFTISITASIESDLVFCDLILFEATMFIPLYYFRFVCNENQIIIISVLLVYSLQRVTSRAEIFL